MIKPLTLPQKNMYETEQFFDTTSMCNVGGCIFFENDIDVDILKKAINKLIENSDGLRIRVINNNDATCQEFYDYKYEDIKIENLTSDSYKSVLENWMKKVFVITEKLYEFKIVKLENRIGVFVKVHHIIADAWCATLIASKILEYYYKLTNNTEIPKDDIPSYIKFVNKEEEYLNSKKFEKDSEYWSSKYESKPSFVTMSPNKKSNLDATAKRSSFVVPIAETEAIRKYCSDNMISVAVLLEAVTSLYAARINNADDVTLCSLVINRSGNEEKNTIGMFNNILPLTIPIDYNETFFELCQKIGAEHYEVFRHQKYPLSNIMKNVRDKHGVDTQLYDIMVSYQNAKVSYENDLRAETEWIFNGTSDLGFMINISDRNDDGLLSIDFDYRVNCFDEEEIENIYYRFINIINQIVVNKDILCKDVEIVTLQEKEQILVDFNNTIKEYPREKCLHYFLEENAVKNPDKIALKFDGNEMTYREFNEKVNSLANYIISCGTSRNAIIGVMVERSFEMLIAIYAILKSGNCYMPMDPHFPDDRIEFMLEDSETPLILTQTKWINKFENSNRIIDLNKFDFEKYSKENPNTSVVSMDTAYVIYTSGSTGKPKGAAIPHHSAINRIKWMHEKYPLESGDVILQKTPYTFDVSVWELFWWSMYDGTLQILIPEGHKEPTEIIDAVYNGRVTHMHFVPSMLNAFLEYLEINQNELYKLSTLRYVFASGEALQVEHVKKFYELLEKNGTTLHNLYGPTECTVDVSYYDCDKDNIPKSIPIGKPVDNTQLLVLDKNRKLLPVGVVGELYISGVLVGKGYVNRDELTKEKFVPNLYYDYATMYKTGDLAMWLPDGNIEYLGRTDFQIKIRGLRVELGDIENAILKYDGIKQSIVVALDLNGEKNLCAYYTASKDIDEEKLREVISKNLPDYMVPGYFMRLDSIPVNSNGKADRKAFPIPEIKKKEIEYIAPKNELEEKIQKCIQDTLNLDKVSVEADLFTMGLTSIGVISIITKLSAYGYELKVRDFYECHTVAEIANLLQNTATNTDDYEDDKINYSDISDIKNHMLPSKDGNAIMVTGASGFLSIHIIRELIKNTNKNIYCLIRSKEKFKRFIEKYTDILIENPRLIIVEGDITKENMGFDEKTSNDVKKNISDIIHCAADVTFFCPWEKIRKVNYEGTCNVIKFAKDSKAKLHHISTMSVSGDILTKQTKEYPEFSEDDLYIGQLYKENVYSYSKYLAEKEVIKSIRNNEINASIYRVANLTWRAEDGVFQERYQTNDLYILTKTMMKYNKVPLELINENIVLTPVDDCARAITALMDVKENSVYNLYSKESMTIGEYISTLTDASLVPINKFYDELINNTNDAKSQFVSMYISGILTKTESSVVQINNSSTNCALEKLNFKWSKLGKEYIEMFNNIGGK